MSVQEKHEIVNIAEKKCRENAETAERKRPQEELLAEAQEGTSVGGNTEELETLEISDENIQTTADDNKEEFAEKPHEFRLEEDFQGGTGSVQQAAVLVSALDSADLNLNESNESDKSLNLVIDEDEPMREEDDESGGASGSGGAEDSRNASDKAAVGDCENKGGSSSAVSTGVGGNDAEQSEKCESRSVNVIEIDDDAEEELPSAVDNVHPTEDASDSRNAYDITVIEIDDEEESKSSSLASPVETAKTEVNGENAAVERELSTDADKQHIATTTSDGTEREQEEVVEGTKNSVAGTDMKPVDTLLEESVNSPPSTPDKKADQDVPATGDEMFYNKECINYECPRQHKQFYGTSHFVLSYYKVSKKKHKPQYVCVECFDKALEEYERFGQLLVSKQPLLLSNLSGMRQEYVEIIDSSDEEGFDEGAVKETAEGTHFKKPALDMIEKELDATIREVLEKVEIQNQLTWSKTILTARAKRVEEEAKAIDLELRTFQKKADEMYVSLYNCPKIRVRQLQPLDLNSGRPYVPGECDTPQMPPSGEIQRPPIQLNETYYAVKNKAIASWVPCKIIEQVEGAMVAQKDVKHYKIKFLKSQYQMLKTVSVKHMAYFDPPAVRLPIGTRVIAYFDASSLSRGKEKMMIQSAFYPGIIAEPLKPNNKFRYLIFYDDGYTQYVCHKDVRLVCHVSENVWEDVHPASRDFIQKYLTEYSINRPMVQTQKGQSMTTESNGKWTYARVIDIDCSLIQMQFEGPKSHSEWIYRGSMRLGPVFKESQKALQKDALPISRLPRRTEPFIRYTEDEEASTVQQGSRLGEPRAVAKKSASRQDSGVFAQYQPPQQNQAPVQPVRHLNNSTIYLDDENKPKGKVVYYTAKRNLPPMAYQVHDCSPTCLFKITHNLNAYSPLSKPLLSGWERMVMRQKIKRVVCYRAPCGKVMRNMKELRNYLRITDNVLNVDNFDFSHETNCLAEYVIESAIVQKRDLSGGQEKMPIPLVNYYDNTMPPECQYAAQRIPTEGVHLNLDEEFLVGCDCEDDCSDKSKCSCWQLTYAGAKYGNPNTPIEDIGYQYKRLYESVLTGIYECNSRCKCKSNCLNRVVQNSLEMKLQVFKTSNRGWGLRCINDVPRGSFICIYAGHLLTEAKANEGGMNAGDEYLAELDYIEVAEQIKEGYESEVEPPELDDIDEDDDDEFTPSKFYKQTTKSKCKPTRSGQPEEDSLERQVINFNPNAEMNESSVRESSIRQLFGKDEACYVMDAKITGNLGRYFNHSCAPNLFVQNVFVDTHDLRFPWVAFFASTHIRAGSELTWNYNYEVGVVPGKVLYCQCGAPNCRLRLL